MVRFPGIWVHHGTTFMNKASLATLRLLVSGICIEHGYGYSNYSALRALVASCDGGLAFGIGSSCNNRFRVILLLQIPLGLIPLTQPCEMFQTILGISSDDLKLLPIPSPVPYARSKQTYRTKDLARELSSIIANLLNDGGSPAILSS